jgi:endoglucanase
MSAPETKLRRHLIGAAAALAGLALAGAAFGQASTGTSATMRDIASVQLAKQMSPGWNLGNSLESTGGETAWGNPPTTQALMDAVKAAGFKSVRIPVAWVQHADANDNISPVWMARVAEVVGYARQAGLYVLINTHWDGGWAQPRYAKQASVNARLKKLWTQIAQRFKDQDEHLLFAGTNEVMVDGDYGPPKPEYVAVQNGFNQVFVDTVRATGGNNARRHLVVQTFNTNIDWGDAHFVVPRDTLPERLMVEVHYYDPYQFTGDTKGGIWQWGAKATQPAATLPGFNEAYVDAQFQKMKSRFVDQGMAVLMGEYGAMSKTEDDPAGTYRKHWAQYVTSSAVRHGIVPMWWDNGYAGNHEMGLFNRATGAQYFPDLIRTIVDSAK